MTTAFRSVTEREGRFRKKSGNAMSICGYTFALLANTIQPPARIADRMFGDLIGFAVTESSGTTSSIANPAALRSSRSSGHR